MGFIEIVIILYLIIGAIFAFKWEREYVALHKDGYALWELAVLALIWPYIFLRDTNL